MVNNRAWTAEEEELLEELAGLVSFNHIANKVGRTPKAVERKLQRMGLLAMAEQGGWLKGKQFAKAVGVDLQTVLKWKERYNLPIKNQSLRYRKKSTSKQNNYLISPEQFWTWAKKHKELLNFAKIDEDLLFPLPDWYEEEKKKDYYIPQKQWLHYTPEEDAKLWDYYYNKSMTYEEIAPLMKRSVRSLSSRMGKIRKERLVKA